LVSTRGYAGSAIALQKDARSGGMLGWQVRSTEDNPLDQFPLPDASDWAMSMEGRGAGGGGSQGTGPWTPSAHVASSVRGGGFQDEYQAYSPPPRHWLPSLPTTFESPTCFPDRLTFQLVKDTAQLEKMRDAMANQVGFSEAANSASGILGHLPFSVAMDKRRVLRLDQRTVLRIRQSCNRRQSIWTRLPLAADLRDGRSAESDGWRGN
jgi:hypothetical protein